MQLLYKKKNNNNNKKEKKEKRKLPLLYVCSEFLVLFYSRQIFVT